MEEAESELGVMLGFAAAHRDALPGASSSPYTGAGAVAPHGCGLGG